MPNQRLHISIGHQKTVLSVSLGQTFCRSRSGGNNSHAHKKYRTKRACQESSQSKELQYRSFLRRHSHHATDIKNHKGERCAPAHGAKLNLLQVR